MFGIGSQASEEDDEESCSPVETPRKVIGDLAAGLMPGGSKPRFWDTSTSPEGSPGRSPSMASLTKRAQEAGISGSAIQEALCSLADPIQRRKVLQESTPATLSQSTATARKVVSTLFKHTPASGKWKRRLPPKRLSRLLTIGDCLAKARIQTDLSTMLPIDSPHLEVEDEVQNLNFVSELPRQSDRNGPKVVWIRSGPSWTRLRLRSRLSQLMSRRGSLPLRY